jgi:uroporphyrinogen-III synthase
MNVEVIEQTLRGRRIAVPETRELDVFAELLTRRGATVLRCPLVSILDAPDPTPVLEWLRQFNAGACDDLILLTGEGLRRLLSCIDQHQPAWQAPFLERLRDVRKITRGPKPARVLRELGLRPDLAAVTPTSAGVMAALAGTALEGRRVGVQLYGTEPNLPLQDFLRSRGAQVLPVAPYVYADAASDARVRDLILTLAEGSVDAVAFTSMAQVDRLHKVAAVSEMTQQLAVGLDRTLVAAVGPVVADALRQRGVRVDLMPEDAYFLKPLTAALGARLSASGVATGKA